MEHIYKVPGCHEEGYYETLLQVCVDHRVDYLIPLYEPELLGLSERKPLFKACGIEVIVSEPEVIKNCLNKLELSCFMKRHGILAPDTYLDISSIDRDCKWVVKPRVGMGGKGVIIAEYAEVESLLQKSDEPIIQRFIPGTEYSIDVFVAASGRILSIVPRIRLEVRSGEVSKSMTVHNAMITDRTMELLRCLRLYGPATIQGILDSATGQFYFIEVNPRFGGGVPLTMRAGIPYADFIAGGFDPEVMERLHPYQVGLKMLRYDDAVYVDDKGMVTL